MNRTIKAERAWRIPGKIFDRLGTFRLGDLIALSADDALQLFREPSALHRFPDTMASNFRSAVQRIWRQYDGDASNIWSGGISSGELIQRFREFDGVGPKIASMAANILVRDFRVPLADRRDIDISADRQVRRVFERLGLVSDGASREEVIAAARGMFPEYPGIFDFASWEIGREWCKSTKPLCPQCYMRDVCPTAGSL